MKNKIHFSSWKFGSDFQGALLFLEARNMVFFHFKFLLVNLRSGKCGIFIARAGRHLASIRHSICCRYPLNRNVRNSGNAVLVVTHSGYTPDRSTFSETSTTNLFNRFDALIWTISKTLFPFYWSAWFICWLDLTLLQQSYVLRLVIHHCSNRNNERFHRGI